MPKAVAIHAHPDDEVFANAGGILDRVSSGWNVVGVVATGGEASEIRRVSDVTEARRTRLAKYERSLDLLGVSSWAWLGDEAEWEDLPGGHTVASEDPDKLIAAVIHAIERTQPDEILTVGVDGLTGHPDHVAIGRAVHKAAHIYGDVSVHAASLPRAAVKAGYRLLAQLGHTNAGSGRVRGTHAALDPISVGQWEITRRAAMDTYRTGLGTADIDSLVNTGSVGDSLVMRAIFESNHWADEFYQRTVEESHTNHSP
ncbi:GlcNAc-PI de-N-acetylase [Branchiibius hedensis]|uniref:GlcNAc-PI de-N-acetylase n=1 Tax=Branchiibius hedensis TaxID=672460 RepID=A0A2Y8ZWV2_9MICO|nr:PIG-L deacetylase family protein [Branchiibius hedensis]PWJ25534.1 GlcNAc-PI de-N-acetylase [Branchiibius hedensis]SSA34347.1 GlcNAc-PI de-N-acetylase [Branchiibius hedensis]